MSKPSKASMIETLLSEIEKGAERGKALGKYGKLWGISRTTFDRHWKTANDKHRERQQKASEAADRAYVATKAEAAKSSVMSKLERLELLTKIAKGEVEDEIKKPAWNNSEKKFQIVTVMQKPVANDKIKAIAEMNKMEGDYAPAKVDVTTKGQGLKPADLSLYSDDELRTIIELQRKGRVSEA